MAKKLRIITDSCCNFSAEEQEKLCISFISTRIQIGDQIIREVGDIDIQEIANLIEKENCIPFILTPTATEIFQVYSMVYSEFDNVISIHLSSLLSPNFEEAKKAQKLLYDTHISVIDTNLSETGLQVLVESIAKMSHNKIPFQTVLTQIQPTQNHFLSYVITNQTKFLKTNTNIPFKGGFPTFHKNQYHLLSLTHNKSISRAPFNQIEVDLLSHLEPLLPNQPIDVVVYHGLDIEKAKAIENVIQGKLPIRSIALKEMSLSSLCRYGTRSVLIGFSFVPDTFVLEPKQDSQ